MLGVLLVAKPLGITSHDVVDSIRRRFKTKRVGHAGTLDPLATGLLVVAVGPATRFLQYLPLEPKEYVAKITFGRATTSYDAEGETTHERSVPLDLQAEIEKQLPAFRGLQQQLPPMFSAVKLNGKPLYTYARKGEEVERKARTVHVSTYDLLDVQESTATVRIVCSGGTYIRTLAHDLGMAIGCGGYLTGLERTQVGRFKLASATPLEEATEADLVPLTEALAPMVTIHLTEQEARFAQDGRKIAHPTTSLSDDQMVSLLGPDGRLLGVGRYREDQIAPECVLPVEVTSNV